MFFQKYVNIPEKKKVAFQFSYPLVVFSLSHLLLIFSHGNWEQAEQKEPDTDSTDSKHTKTTKTTEKERGYFRTANQSTREEQPIRTLEKNSQSERWRKTANQKTRKEQPIRAENTMYKNILMSSSHTMTRHKSVSSCTSVDDGEIITERNLWLSPQNINTHPHSDVNPWPTYKQCH